LFRLFPRRIDEPAAYHAEGILYLVPDARFDHLLTLPEVADIGAKVNAAMREVEKHNPQLAGVLPKTYKPLHRHAAQGPAQEGVRDTG